VIDCNRDEEELDPAAIMGIGPVPVGPRARHGLGLVASRTHRHGALWRRPIDRSELQRRIEQVHRPYHQALSDALDALRARHGEVLLLDCHSMPSRKNAPADVVIGDRYGASAGSWICEEAVNIVQAVGLRTAVNDPYAGGSIISRHGKPRDGIHALQLEIDRSLYLNRDGRTAGPHFDRIASLIEALASGLGELLVARQVQDAAE